MGRINWKSLGRTVVFIDAANLESSAKRLGWWIDYRRLYRFFKKQTQLAGMRHHGARFDNLRHEGFLTVLRRIGIESATKPLKVIKKSGQGKGAIRKANFDVEIAIDALQLVSFCDSLVLLSGDGDFEVLVKTLRAMRKKVIIVSTKHHISKELIRASDQCLDLKKLKGKIVRRQKKSPPFSVGA